MRLESPTKHPLLGNDLSRYFGSMDTMSSDEDVSLLEESPTVMLNHVDTRDTLESPPLISYFFLFLSICSLSSIGNIIKYESEVSPAMKLFWRRSVALLLYFTMSSVYIYKRSCPKITYSIAFSVIKCGVSYAIFAGSFLLALEYTSVGNAYLFSNTHTLLLVFRRYMLQLPVSRLELVGVLLALGGGILCSIEPVPDMATASQPWIGNLLALAAAFAGVVYLTESKYLRPKLPLPILMAGQCAAATIVTLLYILCFEDFSFSQDVDIGLFGWSDVQGDRLGVALYFAFICDLVGTMGMIRVLSSFDPMIVSVAMTLEPVVATVEGVLLHLCSMPGERTIIGSIIVISGTIIVLSGRSNSPKQFLIKQRTSQVEV